MKSFLSDCREARNRRKGFMAILCKVFRNRLLLSMSTHLPEEPSIRIVRILIHDWTISVPLS